MDVDDDDDNDDDGGGVVVMMMVVVRRRRRRKQGPAPSVCSLDTFHPLCIVFHQRHRL